MLREENDRIKSLKQMLDYFDESKSKLQDTNKNDSEDLSSFY